MSYPPRQVSQAHLGASYYPGRDDDFQIPVVSPMPQRNNPEMPDHISQNLAHLELEARSGSVSELPSPVVSNGNGSYSQPGSRHGSATHQHSATEHSPRSYRTEDEPSFSPFPKLRNRKLNVPPSDDEKEEILEKARDAVLNSNDPEMQLAWAQDTLAYVDIAQQNERRLAEFCPPRPQTPRVERRLRIDAVNIVDFLGQQHHPKAEFLRGTWLEFGRFGFEMDKREAFRCYSRSAQNGYARAEYRMGMQFESSNEIEKAVRHYNLGVQANDVASNYRVGMMTLMGQHGQLQDFARALDMIKFSADHADENAPQGAYVYGMLHIRELPQVNVPDQFLAYDINAAKLNIEKAAYLGFAKAQVKMGAAYELGEIGCDFDPILSLHYNNLAARQGEADAEMAISKWFLSGYDDVFPKNEAMSFAYAQRAAATGLPTAEFAMGYFYEVGIHVPTDLKEARVWYKKASEHGNKDAAGRIDGISRSKTLSRKDHDKIAMARIKSQRGQQNPNSQQPPQSRIPSASMPHIPETYGQSYANPSGPPPNQNSYGHHPPSTPYSQGYGPAAQMPQPGRPPYAPPNQGPGQPQGPYDHSYSTPGNNQQYSRPGPSPGPPYYAQTMGPGPGGPGYGAQLTPQPGYRPSGNMYPPQQRVPSGPPGPPQNRVPSGPMQPRPGPSPAPDIGFSAPPDLAGADRRRLPQAAPTNRPPPGRGGLDPQNYAPSPRPGASPRPPGVQTPRQDSLARPRPPSSVDSRPTPPISTGPSKPPSSAAAAQRPKPPGKGPSTFEEMGVPQHKKNEDCVVM